MHGNHAQAWFCSGGVAGQAVVVVRFIIMDNLLMRVVARDATDSWIGAIETLTVGEAVGLKAHVNFAVPIVAQHGFPCAVTLTAEAGDIFGGKLL